LLSVIFTAELTEYPFRSIVTLAEIQLWNSLFRNGTNLPKYFTRNPTSSQWSNTVDKSVGYSLLYLSGPLVMRNTSVMLHCCN